MEHGSMSDFKWKNPSLKHINSEMRCKYTTKHTLLNFKLIYICFNTPICKVTIMLSHTICVNYMLK